MKNKQTNMKFNTYMICSKLPNTEEMRERLKQTARSLCPQTVRSFIPIRPTTLRVAGGRGDTDTPYPLKL